MNDCKRVRKLLVAYFSDELEAMEVDHVKAHVEKCQSCQIKYHQIQDTFRGIGYLQEDCNQAVKARDWGSEAVRLKRTPVSSKPADRRYFPFHLSRWKVSSFAMATVFILGLMAGFFLFHSTDSTGVKLKESENFSDGLNRIETTLSRRQILDYFKKTQLLLTGVMEQCHIHSGIPLNKRSSTEQIKLLLVKNRYFSQDLNDPQLMSSKNLLRKIELILYEMLIMKEEINCEQIQRIQRLIQKERLLLKIRLIEKELSSYEV